MQHVSRLCDGFLKRCSKIIFWQGTSGSRQDDTQLDNGRQVYTNSWLISSLDINFTIIDIDFVIYWIHCIIYIIYLTHYYISEFSERIKCNFYHYFIIIRERRVHFQNFYCDVPRVYIYINIPREQWLLMQFSSTLYERTFRIARWEFSTKTNLIPASLLIIAHKFFRRGNNASENNTGCSKPD